ncbi:unnamed protein product [Calicophoron daubneyi]|uniref:Peptidase S1 domain-containing protein n=1 Tax=Calicophoron daubneyi TaxID=300641 RepID=A0AAV2TUD5_CALDB
MHFVFELLFFCRIVEISGSTNGTEISKRVINGRHVKAGDYPWAVSIIGVNPLFGTVTYCGATVLDDRWMVTAAHCFRKGKDRSKLMDPENWHVQAGNPSIELKPYTMGGEMTSKWFEFLSHVVTRYEKKIWNGKLEKIVLHPKFSAGEMENDIALVRLAKKLPLGEKYITAAYLPPAENPYDWPKVHSSCALVGWGCKSGEKFPSSEAQVISLKVIPNALCYAMYGGLVALSDEHEFCASPYKSGSGICPGDSGSGLVCGIDEKRYVVGVATATHAKHPETFPGLFTRISFFTEWIKKQMTQFNETFKHTQAC